ncbi:SulP family inorganic anion transporter [Planctomicrobium sp. SH527]|uniref:SulP family inorganic anion transporter n=1 Tax=Planctomicrobium sp. SH527 TaxID=3448123 RepID=UPI003F5B6152
MHSEQSKSEVLQTSPNKKRSTFSSDFAASIVVFLVALPLCMGVSIASGVPIAAGLVTGIVAGIVVGFLAGCPLQVSGPAAGLTVIVYQAVQTHGLKMLGLIVLIAGIFQLIAGFMRFGQWFRAVSPSVVYGMLAGIGVLILASQFHVMLDDTPGGSGVKNLLTIPSAITKAAHVPQLPAKDMRGDLQSILKDLGDLHRRQISLNEEVTERIPDHTKKLQPEAAIELTDFGPRQAAILEELKLIQQRGLELKADLPVKRQRIEELGNLAIKDQEVSLSALESNRSDLIVTTQVHAAEAITNFQKAFKNHEFAAALGVLTIIVLVLWKAFAKGPLAVVPAPLVGVVAATAVATYWQLPVLYVEVPAAIMEDLHFVKWSTIIDANWGGILTSAAVIAAVASAETLLCATAVDSLHSGARTNYDKELASQGVGNIICGFMGALPMTGVIVRSSANVQAGAKTRASSILHGVWFLVFVALLASMLKMIPTAALAGILVYTGYKLVDKKAVVHLAKFGWSEVFIWAATVFVIVVEDLLLGVITGLVLAVGKLVIKFSMLKVNVVSNAHSNETTVNLEGNASFLRLPKLARGLERVPAGSTVSFDLSKLNYLDQACLELLGQWAEQHRQTGGNVEADWKMMERFACGAISNATSTDKLSRVA